MTKFEETYKIVSEEIRQERLRQIEKWGEQHHHIDRWIVVLGEEFGESCEAALDLSYSKPEDIEERRAHLRDEITQVAAVAAQILEVMEEERLQYG